ncbi:hypothetical protein NL676_036252 [Syzygium grande]|nr:hypothetical protein NL676_036252 [Syzygium grande]
MLLSRGPPPTPLTLPSLGVVWSHEAAMSHVSCPYRWGQGCRLAARALAGAGEGGPGEIDGTRVGGAAVVRAGGPTTCDTLHSQISRVIFQVTHRSSREKKNITATTTATTIHGVLVVVAVTRRRSWSSMAYNHDQMPQEQVPFRHYTDQGHHQGRDGVHKFFSASILRPQNFLRLDSEPNNAHNDDDDAAAAAFDDDDGGGGGGGGEEEMDDGGGGGGGGGATTRARGTKPRF